MGKKKEQRVSPFFKFTQPGDSIEGVYAGLQKTHGKGKIKDGVAIVLLTQNASKLVNVTYEIHATLSDVLQSLRVGKSRLRFVYDSTEKTNQGYRVKKFSVYVDGKLLERKGGFVTVTDAKSVKSLFDSAVK